MDVAEKRYKDESQEMDDLGMKECPTEESLSFLITRLCKHRSLFLFDYLSISMYIIHIKYLGSATSNELSKPGSR